jgi:SAM-dependent methyltransferase
MRKAINTSVRIFTESFEPSGPVVEIGSLYLQGYEKISDLRRYFKGEEYIGCDMRQGLGVDRIEDAQALSFADNSIGTVILLDVLEHLPYPQKAIEEAHRVLCDNGILVLSVPFSYRLHGFPSDYWRFTANGIHILLSGFTDKIVFSLGPSAKPAFIFAIAVKGYSFLFEKKKALFQQRILKAFRNSHYQGCISVLKERSRDLFGFLIGRAGLSVIFFDPSMKGGYKNNTS